MKQRVAALVGPVADKMWVSTFHSACVRILRREAAAAGLPVGVHHLRPGRRRAPHRLRPPGSQPRLQAVPAPVRCTRRSARPRTKGRSPARTPTRANDHLRAQGRRRLRRVSAPPPQGRRHGLRRPAAGHRPAVPQAARRARVTTSDASATCWSTSTRTPTRSRTSWCCCWRASTATSASWATPTSRSTASAVPTSATSSSSRRPSPTPRSWCSSRTTARPRPSSTPPTRSSPTTSGRKPKELWTDAGPGDPILRYHADDEGDEAQFVAARAGPSPRRRRSPMG